jgi:hypothetical protein
MDKDKKKEYNKRYYVKWKLQKEKVQKKYAQCREYSKIIDKEQRQIYNRTRYTKNKDKKAEYNKRQYKKKSSIDFGK